MTITSIFVLFVLIAMFAVLIFDKMRPGLTLFSSAVVLMGAGIISPKEAVSGFSNTGMITVALLFLVSEGVRQSGALNGIISWLLPNEKKAVSKINLRLLPFVSLSSAFLNNTAIVVIFAPIIKRWAEMIKTPSTKYLIPLSYATILGGSCTLIGTSTNLVVNGMMQDSGYEGFSMFELGRVGIVIVAVGLVYLIWFSKYLLPNKRGGLTVEGDENTKIYYYITRVLKNSSLIGLSSNSSEVEVIIPFVSAIKVNREGESFDVKEEIVILEGDELLVMGDSNTPNRLRGSNDVVLSCLDSVDTRFNDLEITQAEVVLAPRFPGLGQTLKEFDFYRHYGAVVMSVHRNGGAITVNLDDLVLREGDNLVLLTDSLFFKTWGSSSVFYLVTENKEYIAPSPKRKKIIAIVLVALMVVGASLSNQFTAVDGRPLGMFFFCAITVVLMAWFNIFPPKKYTKYISWDILIAIASAFAISKAMFNSGLADVIASGLISISNDSSPAVVLMMMYIVTALFTELITNNAAAALMFPISLAISTQLGVSPYPFFVTICIAASSSFLTPIGYQTNLIVQSIGGYKFSDYWKVGLPLTIIVFIITVTLVPVLWNF